MILTVWIPIINTTLSMAIENCVAMMAIWAIWIPNQSTSRGRQGEGDESMPKRNKQIKVTLIKIRNDETEGKRNSYYSFRPHHSKRRQDPDSAWNLHLFAIRTSARREWKCSGIHETKRSKEKEINFSLHIEDLNHIKILDRLCFPINLTMETPEMEIDDGKLLAKLFRKVP